MTSLSRTIKISTASDIGGSREMQDSVGFNEKRVMVADGHGKYGQEIATHSLSTALQHTDCFGDELFNMMEHNASVTMESILRNHNASWLKNGGFYVSNGLVVKGGTTATVLSILDDGFELSNVGDSEAMFVQCETKAFEMITADHSPTNLNEFLEAKKRFPNARFMFEKEYGRYQTDRPVFRQNPDGEWVMNMGLTYSTVRNDFGSYVEMDGNCISMTRSIGDFHMKKVMTHLPTTIRRKNPDTPTVHAYVIASDGMWDAVQYQAICDIVCEKRFVSTLDSDEAVKALMDYAKQENMKYFGKNYDNIAIAVVYVRYE